MAGFIYFHGYIYWPSAGRRFRIRLFSQKGPFILEVSERMDQLRQFLNVESLTGPILMLALVFAALLGGAALTRKIWRAGDASSVSKNPDLGEKKAVPQRHILETQPDTDPELLPETTTQIDQPLSTQDVLNQIAQRAAEVRAESSRGKRALHKSVQADIASPPIPQQPRDDILLLDKAPVDKAPVDKAPGPGPVQASQSQLPRPTPVPPTRVDTQSMAEKLARNLAQRSVRRHSARRQATEIGLAGFSDELTRAVKAIYDHRYGAAPLGGIESVLLELEAGNGLAAEGVFRTLLEQKRKGGSAMMHEAAQAARSLGALARLRDEQASRLAYEESVTLDDRDPVAWNELGHLRRRAGQHELAVQAYERVLAIGNQTGDRAATAAATGNLGVIAAAEGRHRSALVRFGEALTLAQELGDRAGEAAAFSNLGLTYHAEGNVSQAEQSFLASLALHGELGMDERVARDHASLGLVYDASDMIEKAEQHLSDAVALSGRIGDRDGQALHAGSLGIIQQKRNDLSGAQTSYKLALALATELGRDESVADQQGNLGSLAHSQGDIPAACAHWTAALEGYVSLDRREEAARIREWLVYAKCSDVQTGVNRLE